MIVLSFKKNEPGKQFSKPLLSSRGSVYYKYLPNGLIDGDFNENVKFHRSYQICRFWKTEKMVELRFEMVNVCDTSCT